MKTPQELNDDYSQYVENAVIELDNFFNEKIIQAKRHYPTQECIMCTLSRALPSQEEIKMRNYLNDKNIIEGFVGSCELFGWNVEIDMSGKLDKITFSPKESVHTCMEETKKKKFGGFRGPYNNKK